MFSRSPSWQVTELGLELAPFDLRAHSHCPRQAVVTSQQQRLDPHLGPAVLIAFAEPDSGERAGGLGGCGESQNGNKAGQGCSGHEVVHQRTLGGQALGGQAASHRGREHGMVGSPSPPWSCTRCTTWAPVGSPGREMSHTLWALGWGSHAS